jgi:hypothetical protein
VALVSDAQSVYRAHPTDDEIADVLGQRLTATLGTHNSDGSIHLAYVIFLHEDGRLYLETSSITRKAHNARRDGGASMLVQGRAATGRALMVAAEGRARVVGGSEAQEVNRRLRGKYLRPEVLDAIGSVWVGLDDVAIEITPDRWRSWSASPFRDATAAELEVPYEDAWLPDD